MKLCWFLRLVRPVIRHLNLKSYCRFTAAQAHFASNWLFLGHCSNQVRSKMSSGRAPDVYEDEDSDAERFEKRYKDVGVVDVGLGADFEDEEISEDAAFDADDDAQYGQALRVLGA